MKRAISQRDRFDHLAKIISSEKFLSKKEIRNEIPFFICPFPPSEAFAMDDDRKRLVKLLGGNGVRVLDINLYDLALSMLEDRGVLDQVLEVEHDTDKSELKEFLQGVLDSETHLIPKIGELINSTQHDVIFISGVGEVYPFIRSHSVLNNLQSTAKERPTVLFFPGEYTHALANGASLVLFEVMHDDKYYRAFNILDL